MPVWPKFVYGFRMSLRTAATQRKLRDPKSAVAAQDETFRSLIARLAVGSFWKQHGIEPGITYAQFQVRVPLQTYAQIAPAIVQMKRGESNVLWPGECRLFGLTPATSTGSPKCLPMTHELLAHFSDAGAEALLYYTARMGNVGVFRGRHFYSGAPMALTQPDDSSAPGSNAGQVSGIIALNFPAWVERHLHEPGAAIANSPADSQLDAIAGRVAARDITMIAGLPGSVAVLADALRKKIFAATGGDGELRDCWPHLECFAHSGAPVAPHAAELKAALGKQVTLHEIYAASEAVIAAQDGDAAQGLRVMADMGIFFEFVALAEYDDLRLERLGPKAVPLSGVKANIDYVILLTTPGGLARYVLGDVVRFTSVTPPRLVLVGGTELRLNSFGENVTEREVTSSIVGLCERQGWMLVNFHVAPLMSTSVMTGRRGAHEWWVELRPGTVVTPTGPQMAVELDANLRGLNSSYAAKRAAGLIDRPIVRLVMPGVFEHWLRYHDKWGGQHKMPRCRGDRRIADEFARVTNFAKD